MNAGKNKRRQLEAYDSFHRNAISADSAEEIDFLNWLCEAAQLSVVNDFVYQPSSFTLFQAAKYEDVDGKQRSLLQQHVYSPDFIVAFDGSKHKDLAKELRVSRQQLSSECSVWIDVKGTFVKTARSFSVDRKWMWDKFKTYIYELVPVKFFAKFGVPEKSKLTAKTKKPRSCYKGFKDLSAVFR